MLGGTLLLLFLRRLLLLLWLLLRWRRVEGENDPPRCLHYSCGLLDQKLQAGREAGPGKWRGEVASK